MMTLFYKNQFSKIYNAILPATWLKSTRNLALALIVSVIVMPSLTTPSANAAGAVETPHYDWSFTGFFGTFDRNQLQRGLQVYTEVCSACHGMKLVAYRNLSDLGYNEAQIKTYARQFEVAGKPDEFGDPTTRPAEPSDRFQSPYRNDTEARSLNNGALPPDLSLIVKARAHSDASPLGFIPNFFKAITAQGYASGTDYVTALMTGYEDAPQDMELLDGLYYNKYFPGNQIAMAPQIYEGSIEYADGTPATELQMAKDVAVFLTWASEPKFEERKALGIKVIAFLLFFIIVLYFSKRSIWSRIKH